jgi:beta-glucosidase
MGRLSRLLPGAVALAVLAAMSGFMPGALASAADADPAAASSSCPWVGAKGPVSQQVAEVLSQMTLDDKVGMLGLASSSDGYENVTTAVPGLCIPRLVLQDGPAGVTAGPARSHTQLPAPIDVGATFDPALARQYGVIQGSEALAKGIDAVQGPDVNIARVPQNGRNSEIYGEDPYLTSQLGVADIDGIQSQGEMAMVKHLDDYNQETGRNTLADNEIVSDRVLHEIYLPAFQAAVQEGHVASVMCSYAVINGVFSCQNPLLLTDVLRDQWGFQGFIRSDLGAVHSVVPAIDAGTDQIKPSAGSQIEAAVADGQVSQARIDQSVGRILTAMFRFGVFDRTSTGTAARFTWPDAAAGSPTTSGCRASRWRSAGPGAYWGSWGRGTTAPRVRRARLSTLTGRPAASR